MREGQRGLCWVRMNTSLFTYTIPASLSPADDKGYVQCCPYHFTLSYTPLVFPLSPLYSRIVLTAWFCTDHVVLYYRIISLYFTFFSLFLVAYLCNYGINLHTVISILIYDKQLSTYILIIKFKCCLI